MVTPWLTAKSAVGHFHFPDESDEMPSPGPVVCWPCRYSLNPVIQPLTVAASESSSSGDFPEPLPRQGHPSGSDLTLAVCLGPACGGAEAPFRTRSVWRDRKPLTALHPMDSATGQTCSREKVDARIESAPARGRLVLQGPSCLRSDGAVTLSRTVPSPSGVNPLTLPMSFGSLMTSPCSRPDLYCTTRSG